MTTQELIKILETLKIELSDEEFGKKDGSGKGKGMPGGGRRNKNKGPCKDDGPGFGKGGGQGKGKGQIESILQEASTVSDADVKKIDKMTQRNDHTGARIYIAEKLLKDKKLAEVYKAISTIQLYVGHIPSELRKLRDIELESKLKDKLQTKFEEPSFKLIWGAL